MFHMTAVSFTLEKLGGRGYRHCRLRYLRNNSIIRANRSDRSEGLSELKSVVSRGHGKISKSNALKENNQKKSRPVVKAQRFGKPADLTKLELSISYQILVSPTPKKLDIEISLYCGINSL